MDGEAILRFTLRTLKQFVDVEGRRDKLREKLRERARREEQEPCIDSRAAELKQWQGRRSELQAQKEVIEHRMAREKDDALYAAVARQYQSAVAELTAAEEAVTRLESARATTQGQSPEAQVEAALSLLDEVARVTGDPAARADVNPLLKRLGLWIGLRFRGVVKGKKRIVQRLTSGRMTFGNAPLPVPLFGKDHRGDESPVCGCTPDVPPGLDKKVLARGSSTLTTANADAIKARTNEEAMSRLGNKNALEGLVPAKAAGLVDRVSDRLNGCQPEGISTTNVNRGERI